MAEMIEHSETMHRSTGFSVPVQRIELQEAVNQAEAGLKSVEYATEKLLEAVDAMDDAAVRRASRLAGWTRGHVLTHLARNADALVNLLTWAKTGVEHQSYTSGPDRHADIERGANRPLWLLREDLDAACSRFMAAAAEVRDSDWQAEVVGSQGIAMPAYQIPWVRLREVWVHLMDLDLGVWFDQIPAAHLEQLLNAVVDSYAGRQDTPAVTLRVEDGEWQLNGGSAEVVVSGTSSSMLAWLTGRDAGANLTGPVPSLPVWI